MHMIGVYDISAERTRRRVAALLGEYGVRVQLSAFELDLDGSEVDDLRRRIAAMIEPSTDRVALYPIDRTGLRRPVWIGAGPIESMPDERPRFFVA
jgi:CRISPR-associated protein Cas2